MGTFRAVRPRCGGIGVEPHSSTTELADATGEGRFQRGLMPSREAVPLYRSPVRIVLIS